MGELTIAVVVGALAAGSSALAALFTYLTRKRATEGVEIRFPDGRRHRIANSISGDELNKELALVRREISEAVVNHPAA